VAFRAFPTQPAVPPLDGLCSPAVEPAAPAGKPGRCHPTCRGSRTFLRPLNTFVLRCTTGTACGNRSYLGRAGVECAALDRVRKGPKKGDRSLEQGLGALGYRALLRLSIRSYARCVTTWRSRCSPGLLPLRGLPVRALRTVPPLLCLAVLERLLRRKNTRSTAALQGIDPLETWRRLPRGKSAQPP